MPTESKAQTDECRFIVVYPMVLRGCIAVGTVNFATVSGATHYMEGHNDRPNVLVPARTLSAEEKSIVDQAVDKAQHAESFTGPWDAAQWVKDQMA